MKRIQIYALLFILLLCPTLLVGCEIMKPDANQGQGVSYSTVKINYHYEYDVIIEHYYQETYSVLTGVDTNITITYVPPIKIGYKFLGWTLNSGGSGSLVSSTLTVVGFGADSIYNLYAKYEVITYNVVYHLNGGENSPANPTELTGTKALQVPTRAGYEFGGWYLDADFTYYFPILQLQDNDVTTLDVYAKWIYIYSITYQSNIDNLSVVGNKYYTQYLEDEPYGFDIYLHPERFVGYLFLGWTYEGQSQPVKEVVVSIPAGYNKNLTFVANYLKATSTDDFPGLEITIQNNYVTYVVPEDFIGEIVVPDIAIKGQYVDYPVTMANVLYYGDLPPTVIASDDVEINYQKKS